MSAPSTCSSCGHSAHDGEGCQDFTVYRYVKGQGVQSNLVCQCGWPEDDRATFYELTVTTLSKDQRDALAASLANGGYLVNLSRLTPVPDTLRWAREDDDL